MSVCLQEEVGDNIIQRTRNKVLEVAPDKKTFRWKTEGKAHVLKDSNQGSMLGSGVYSRR